MSVSIPTSSESASRVTFTHYPTKTLGQGAFDGGKITEIKPIPFPQEPGGSRRIGPLLYWAWATAHGDGVIGMHPHQGFEIMSYVLEGAVGHTDTGGHSSRVAAGGAQVMQTGSGISHQEEMHGERTDFFQIWFEPDLEASLREPPVYADFEAEDFTVEEKAGSRLKRVIGKGGAVKITAPVEASDLSLEPGARFTLDVAAGRFAAIVAIEGAGVVESVAGAEGQSIRAREFVVARANEDVTLELAAGETTALRVMWVEGPVDPGYPLRV